jgi:hypothetical protein
MGGEGMRDLIVVGFKKFSLEENKGKITDIVNEFCNYLDFYLTGSMPSKYEIMGPVSKILEMAKNKKQYTENSIKSKALRKHEMNRISGYVSSEAFKKLEVAISDLIIFRDELPEMQIAKVIEIIDGEIYFKERKKNVERFEKIKNEFPAFLKKRYKSNVMELNKKWETNYEDWGNIPFPSNKFRANNNDSVKKDIDDFKNEKKQEEKKNGE